MSSSGSPAITASGVRGGGIHNRSAICSRIRLTVPVEVRCEAARAFFRQGLKGDAGGAPLVVEMNEWHVSVGRELHHGKVQRIGLLGALSSPTLSKKS